MQPQSLNKLIVFFISPPPIIDVSERARLPVVVALISIFSLAHLPLRLTLVQALLVEKLGVETLIFLIDVVALILLI